MSLSIDTNVFVYVHDKRDPEKQCAAREIYTRLATDGSHYVGLQVLGELYAVLTRKLGQSRSDAQIAVNGLPAVFNTFTYEQADVFAALQLATDGVLSYWDGLLVSSAQRAGCTALVSEDMQDGFRFGSLEIIAPFSSATLNPRLATLIGSSAD